jgi:hypothetical protein
LALGEMFEKITRDIEARMKETAGEFTNLARRLGELAGRIDAFVAGVPEPRGRGFKFANEPEDLPNPLTPRRRVLDS